MHRNKPRLLPRCSNFPTVFEPFHPVVCVLSPVRKGGAGVDKEGGLDVFTTFGLAWSQGINCTKATDNFGYHVTLSKSVHRDLMLCADRRGR